MVLNKVEKRCAVCGRLFWKYPYHKKKTCENPDCTTALRRSHRLPESGTCATCGKRGPLAKKGKFAGGQKQCRKCWTLEHRYAECRGCRKVKKIYSHHVCETCFFRLNLSTKIVRCKKCGRKGAHYAKGLCRPCYSGIIFTRWRKANPERYKTYYNNYSKERARKERREHPEVVRAHERRYGKRTTDDYRLAVKGTQFVASAGLGTGTPARCLQNFRLDGRKRLVVYELKGKIADGRRFVVQMIDVTGKTDVHRQMNDEELDDFLISFGFRLS